MDDLDRPYFWCAAIAFAFYAVFHLVDYVRICQLSTVGVWYRGKGHLNSAVMRMQHVMPRFLAAMGTPLPVPWWYTKHVQLVPFILQNRLRAIFCKIPYQELEVATADEKDKCKLRIYPGFAEEASPLPIVWICPGLRSEDQDFPGNTLVRRIVHGQSFTRNIFGQKIDESTNQDSTNGSKPSTRFKFRAVLWLGRGYVSPISGPHVSVPGQVEDLEESVLALQKLFPQSTMNVKWFVISLSAGCAVHSNAMGHWDNRRWLLSESDANLKKMGLLREDIDPPPVLLSGSVFICPGFDTKKCWGAFSPPYSKLLLGTTREFYIGRNEVALRKYHGDAAVDAVYAASNLQEFYNACWRFDASVPAELAARINPATQHLYMDDPTCGDRSKAQSAADAGKASREASGSKPYYLKFGLKRREPIHSLEEFYEKGNPITWMLHVSHPGVAIMAEDDPICTSAMFRAPIENYPEEYSLVDSSAAPDDKSSKATACSPWDKIEQTPCPLAIVSSPTGSHCPSTMVPRRGSLFAGFMTPTAEDGRKTWRWWKLLVRLEICFHFIWGVLIWPFECNDESWMLPNWAEEAAVRFCDEVLRAEAEEKKAA